MNKKITLLSILLLAFSTFLFASPYEETFVSLTDFQNKDKGGSIPSWVMEASMGGMPRSFDGIDTTGKKVFIASHRSDDLETAKQEALFSMKKDFMTVIERNLAKRATAVSSVSTSNNTSVSRVLKLVEDSSHYFQITGEMGAVSNVNTEDSNPLQFGYTIAIGNLPKAMTKLCDFWLLCEEKNSKGEVKNSYYEYYLVYAIDNSSFEDILSNKEIIKTANNFSFKLNLISIADPFMLNIVLDENGKVMNYFLERKTNTSSLVSHSRGENKIDSLSEEAMEEITSKLTKKKYTKLLDKKIELTIDVYNNDEYMCTDYYCVYDIDKKYIK